MREKHRSAQRRYRARLRAKHEEADARVEALTRELNELRAEKARLPMSTVSSCCGHRELIAWTTTTVQ